MSSPTRREAVFASLCAGVASGFFFFIVPDATLIFLPGLPLLLLGLASGKRAEGFAALVACFVTAVLTGLDGLGAFFALIALPVHYFVSRALLWREGGPYGREREWYPALRILAELTILAASLLALAALITKDHGGLKGMVPHEFIDSFKEAGPDYAAVAQQLSGDGGFVFFVCFGWIWVLTIYAFALLANFILKWKNLALRPSLALEPHSLPGWLFVLVILSGGLAMGGQGMDRFTAEALLPLLLLPYLLCGLAYVHALSLEHRVALRRVWIGCFYFVLIRFYWLPLAVIAVGLYLQLSEMLDRWRKIG